MVLDYHVQHRQPERLDALGCSLSLVLHLVVDLLRYPWAVALCDRPLPDVVQLRSCSGLIRVEIVYAVYDLVDCDRTQPEPNVLAQDHKILVQRAMLVNQVVHHYVRRAVDAVWFEHASNTLGDKRSQTHLLEHELVFDILVVVSQYRDVYLSASTARLVREQMFDVYLRLYYHGIYCTRQPRTAVKLFGGGYGESPSMRQ